MRLAQVVVDLPTMQTDVPFTYQIPAALASSVKPGMRVVVPFGAGGRQLQGIVVGFTDHSRFRLKPITSLMDLTPVIDPELLKLSRWLAKTTFSFWISCLLTMLPNVMKAKYERKMILVRPVRDPAVQQLFHHRLSQKYDPKHFSHQQLRLVIRLRQKRLLYVRYLVKNQARPVKVMTFRNRLSQVKLRALFRRLPSNQIGRRALVRFLVQHPRRRYTVSKVIKKVPHLRRQVIRFGDHRHWLRLRTMEVRRTPYCRSVRKNVPFRLNHDQAAALKPIATSIKLNHFRVYLLEGVTGSGKTEVYLQAISRALKLGKTALMLVPEITLTPQMVSWVRGRFGDQVAILHSGLSAGERYDEWRRVRTGEARVVVGARSAVFAPLRNLGVIIMDEEHSSSYKQENAPRYQTRSVAKWRGRYHHCPVVLGSATPSLESRARATKHVYHLLRLPHRVRNQALPRVHVINMRTEIMRRRETNYSAALLKAIRLRLRRHEQVILMLNRRGYSSFVMCRDCGYVPKCPNCDISLTYHTHPRVLKCHYCGYTEMVPRVCPRCHSYHIRYFGTGTEQAERELKRLIPGIQIIRMDVDTTSRKGAHARLLRRFGTGHASVLLGTQMIAKGLDFPNVTLVGVLNADTTLALPDFRAAERTFQLLTQVSGRAGRAQKRGEVFIQTFNPNNYAIRLARQQNYEKFYLIEMNRRHRLNYPPYFYTIRIVTSCVNRNRSAWGIFRIKSYLTRWLSPQTLLLGPAPSVIARIKRRYYYQIVLKYKYEPKLQSTLAWILRHCQGRTWRGVSVEIDPDPTNLV